MKPTVRLVAEVEPEVKQKLKDIAKAKDVSMTEILVNYINAEHKKIKK